MDQHAPERDLASHEQKGDDDADSQLERQEEYKAIIESDPLLDEVGKANRQISNPSERRKVVPSKPC
jgi:hypothetical protein